MAQTALDPDDLQTRLRNQLPSEWGVRVFSFERSDGLTVTMHHREQAALTIRTATPDGEYKVSAREPGSRAPRRLLHPEDVDYRLALDRCVDHAVVRAYQYCQTGSFLSE